MAVIYLFYTEDDDYAGNLSPNMTIPMLDQFTYMFGGEYVAIHPKDADYPPRVPKTFPTLEDAKREYSDYKWFYLDSKAETYLDEITHPQDNVVYAVGHDRIGFGKSKLNGEKVRLRTIQPDFEGYSIATLISVICDRWTITRNTKQKV